MKHIKELGKSVNILEEKIKRAYPEHKYSFLFKKRIYRKLRDLPHCRSLFIMGLAFGLIDYVLNKSKCRFSNAILCCKVNKFGIRKQKVFDWLELRNGPEDIQNRKMVIELLKDLLRMKKLEIDRLIQKLHIKLIKEVMDADRPDLKLKTAKPEGILHEEFELDTRFPQIFAEYGPKETRFRNYDKRKPYPLTQKELDDRLKKVFKKNCVRWKEMVRQYTRNDFPKSKSVANSREYPNSKMKDNNIGS